MTQEEQIQIQKKRYEQIDGDIITKIYRTLRKSEIGDEIALAVAVQLRNTEHYNRLAKREREDAFKSLSDKLRDIANSLED